MKHLANRLIQALLVATLPVMALGQDTGMSSAKEKISHIISATGLENEVVELPSEISSQFRSNPFGLSPSQNREMVDEFDEIFTRSSLMDDVRDSFIANYDTAYVDTAIAWLEKDHVKKIHQAAKEMFTVQGMRKEIIRKYEVEQDPPPEERRKALQKLLAVTNATEFTIDSFGILFRSFVEGFDILNDQQSFTNAQLDGFVSNYKSQLRSEVRSELLRQHIITYYDIELTDIENYTEFYQTEAGHWLSTTTAESIKSAFRENGDRFIVSVKKMSL